MIDGILLLGFGGPTPGCCERRSSCAKSAGCEAECFVSGILGDNPARAARVAEVTAHYRRLGGFSPYNQLTEEQAEALRHELIRRGHALKVACGFRHWRPWTIDGMSRLAADGCREIALLVMAPHQSSVSWDWYLKHAAEAAQQLGTKAPRIAGVVEPWWKRSGYIDAIASNLREATASWSSERIAQAELIFTAHAIPDPVAQTSRYREQFAETARLAADAFGHSAHVVGYQSAPSDSRVPWTGPDIVDLIAVAKARGKKDVLVQAAGFLVDHTEVLYDLDIEAREKAEALGIGYTRAKCVHAEKGFVRMLADGVEGACGVERGVSG